MPPKANLPRPSGKLPPPPAAADMYTSDNNSGDRSSAKGRSSAEENASSLESTDGVTVPVGALATEKGKDHITSFRGKNNQETQDGPTPRVRNVDSTDQALLDDGPLPPLIMKKKDRKRPKKAKPWHSSEVGCKPPLATAEMDDENTPLSQVLLRRVRTRRGTTNPEQVSADPASKASLGPGEPHVAEHSLPTNVREAVSNSNKTPEVSVMGMVEETTTLRKAGPSNKVQADSNTSRDVTEELPSPLYNQRTSEVLANGQKTPTSDPQTEEVLTEFSGCLSEYLSEKRSVDPVKGARTFLQTLSLRRRRYNVNLQDLLGDVRQAVDTISSSPGPKNPAVERLVPLINSIEIQLNKCEELATRQGTLEATKQKIMRRVAFQKANIQGTFPAIATIKTLVHEKNQLQLKLADLQCQIAALQAQATDVKTRLDEINSQCPREREAACGQLQAALQAEAELGKVTAEANRALLEAATADDELDRLMLLMFELGCQA